MKLSPELSLGIIIGLLGGIAGNILVTVTYRLVDKNPNGNNWIDLSLSIFIIILIVVIFWKKK